MSSVNKFTGHKERGRLKVCSAFTGITHFRSNFIHGVIRAQFLAPTFQNSIFVIFSNMILPKVNRWIEFGRGYGVPNRGADGLANKELMKNVSDTEYIILLDVGILLCWGIVVVGLTFCSSVQVC